MIMNSLLLRRNINALDTEEFQAEAESLVEQRESDQERCVLTPSHKRKQSDTVALGDFQFPRAENNPSHLRLDRIEQGSDDEENDSPPISPIEISQACEECNKSSTPTGKGARLLVGMLALTALASLRSARSRGKANQDDNVETVGSPKESFLSENVEVIGDPKEAAPKHNWIEFYDEPDRMSKITSSGPRLVDPDVGGLHVFENVCVTNNAGAANSLTSDTSTRGLIYFTDDRTSVTNPKRCVPCSGPAMPDNWEAASDDESVIGHKCGMNSLHAMYASSVTDWNDCMSSPENQQLMNDWNQVQSPSHADHVHFFDQSTLLLQFQANDAESSLFDTLLSYLPHWHKFTHSDSFPFTSVLSHSTEGCLSHSRSWFCEVAHQMGAFGQAKEIPWEPDDTTLYCFKNLYFNQIAYQHDLKHEGLVTKDIMDDFRDTVSRNFALPRPRDMTQIWAKDARTGIKRPVKIVLYANEPQGSNVWKGLDELVSSTEPMKKYHDVEFVVIKDFDDLTVAQQAHTFNEADAVVTTHGEHMANAVFATDGVSFVEVGCSSQTLIGNPNFMSLVSGTHTSVSECGASPEPNEICVKCSGEELDSNFSMTGIAFHALIDDILKSHQDKVSFARDSM